MMSDKDKKIEKDTEKNIEKEEKMTLDDAARVRVLSPGMMVLKRFLRNRLAIVGIVIIVGMFLFAFLGGVLVPYSQSEVFYTTEVMLKDYAGTTVIDQYQFVNAPGEQLPKDIYSKTIMAVTKNDYAFESRSGGSYGISPAGDEVYIVYSLTPQTGPLWKQQEFKDAAAAGKNVFEKDGELYLFNAFIERPAFYKAHEIAVGSMKSFTAYSSSTSLSYEFCREALIAGSDKADSFKADGTEYSLNVDESGELIYLNGEEYAFVSPMNFNPVVSGTYLSPAYKMTALEAIAAGEESFSYPDSDGTEVRYILQNKNGQYLIRRNQETKVIDKYASPSKEHIFGTDGNGMDLLTRLMYGGRISLLIGFVVIAIEVTIGTILGGIAGFFGGWVDNFLMRVVDVVYCIPSMPLYLILGSIMDWYQAPATARIYLLCVVMAVIGWVGIARIVRGQILSLREQEFMIAAEATGISVRRRIFKHLIPNVVPQLIVYASMGLGEVILAEATLSYLGLGIKYPAASWGSIINAVNDSYVMTNYLFVWVPAGFFILLTVLAFNFIGDGLRDAFDPRMKR